MFKGSLQLISSVFERSSKGISRQLQGYLKKSSKGVSRQCQRCFKEVSWVYKESVKCASRKFQKKFQGSFKNVSIKFLFCNFVLARISSQLPEQKEGLLII